MEKMNLKQMVKSNQKEEASARGAKGGGVQRDIRKDREREEK